MVIPVFQLSIGGSSQSGDLAGNKRILCLYYAYYTAGTICIICTSGTGENCIVVGGINKRVIDMCRICYDCVYILYSSHFLARWLYCYLGFGICKKAQV